MNSIINARFGLGESCFMVKLYVGRLVQQGHGCHGHLVSTRSLPGSGDSGFGGVSRGGEARKPAGTSWCILLQPSNYLPPESTKKSEKPFLEVPPERLPRSGRGGGPWS